MRPSKLAHQSGSGRRGRSTVSEGAGPGRGYGNAGFMESVEKQKQLFPSFHAPLEISPKTRDSHIPTARRRPGWKSGKPQSGFPFPQAGAATTARFYFLPKPKTKAKTPPPPRPLLTAQNHVVLETQFQIKKL